MSTIRAELPRIAIRRGPAASTVVYVMARTVVVAGVVVAGFLAYQFGVTSFFATRAQADLGARLAADTGRAVVVPFTAPEFPASPIVVPVDLAPFAIELPGSAPTFVAETPPALGEPVGRITITTAGVDWFFVEGVDRDSLRSGAGHMSGTALPGQPGNAVISGHRTTHGAPFLHLDRVAAGDMITVATASGVHAYQVVDIRLVAPDETWVTGQWEGAWLTLTTCNPVFSARERLVVVARLVAGPNAAAILGAARSGGSA
ncbi:MAG: class E sortase [Acidimicrobiia bacterium]|nr:class E sortase [Acidimicrobiia bacterium]